jgi:holo-[acyl-carrier protein] synthase
VILGTGTDLIDVRRVERALARFGHRFARRVLVEHEYQRFCTHFKPANWHNVSVANERSGRPYLKFSEPLAALLEQRGVSRAHLSLSDEVEMACAFVVLEGKDHE